MNNNNGPSITSNKWRYRQDIDGLRAVAVVAVILYHFNRVLLGGYVGVDVFFVLSGYLITGLMVSDLEQGRFSLASFWERRIRRIWPAASVVTLAVLLAGYLLMLPQEYESLAKDALAQLGMVANIHYCNWGQNAVGYFALEMKSLPLLHFWSLAVEEQFYLVFPLLLVGLWRWGHRWCVRLLVVLAVASLVASVVCVQFDRRSAFYLLPFRAWELLSGSLLAFVNVKWDANEGRWRWAREVIAVVGLGFILWPCWSYREWTLFPGLTALPPCLGAGLVIFAGLATVENAKLPLVNRLLALRPVVFVGQMSYSLYLWHWPLLAFSRYVYGENLSLPVKLFVPICTAFLSYVSWKFIEQPFRRKGLTGHPWNTAMGAALASCLLAGFAAVIWFTCGLPSRFRPDLNAFVSANVPQSLKFQHLGFPDADGEWRFPMLGQPGLENRPAFLLWGDSHALAIAEVIDAESQNIGLWGNAAIVLGRLPVPGHWRKVSLVPRDQFQNFRAWNQAMLDLIRTRKPRNIILCGRWPAYFAEWADGLSELEPSTPDPISVDRLILQGLGQLLELCEETDSKLWILEAVPEQPITVRERAIGAHLTGKPTDVIGVNRAAHERRNEKMKKILSGISSERLRIVDLAEPLFNVDGFSRVGTSEEAWYRDDNHLNKRGVERALSDVIRKMLKKMRMEQ